jgi:hypothetical protein
VYLCPVKAACPGGSMNVSEVSKPMCLGSSLGISCGECGDGYFPVRRGGIQTCTVCPDGQNALVFVFVPIFFIIGVLALYTVANNTAFAAKRKLFSVGTTATQLLSFAQAVAILGAFTISWPEGLAWAFEISKFFELTVDMLNPNCVFGGKESTAAQ